MTSTTPTVTVISRNVIQVATIGIQGPSGPPGPMAPVLQAGFNLSSAIAQVISVVPSQRYPVRIDGLYNLICSSGTINITVAINGIPVTGLDNLTVTTVRQDPVATGANMLNIDDELTIILSGSSLASNLKFTLQGTPNP